MQPLTERLGKSARCNMAFVLAGIDIDWGVDKACHSGRLFLASVRGLPSVSSYSRRLWGYLWGHRGRHSKICFIDSIACESIWIPLAPTESPFPPTSSRFQSRLKAVAN